MVNMGSEVYAVCEVELCIMILKINDVWSCILAD